MGRGSSGGGGAAGGMGTGSRGGGGYVEKMGIKISKSSLGKIEGTKESQKQAMIQQHLAEEAWTKSMYAKQKAQSKLYSAQHSGNSKKIQSATEAYNNAVGEYNKALKTYAKAQAKYSAETKKYILSERS